MFKVLSILQPYDINYVNFNLLTSGFYVISTPWCVPTIAFRVTTLSPSAICS